MAESTFKQVCFAGFPTPDIEALQTALRTAAPAWQWSLSPDAGSAILALASHPCDVLVVNVSREGIADPAPLHAAARSHPGIVQFIVGDLEDRELAVKNTAAPHQFITRPWRPQDLISIMQRTIALDGWLMTDKLRALIPRLGALPGVPATYFQVLKIVESPAAGLDAVTEVISRDPALTARLLQLVNSAACGLAETVVHPKDAIGHLGLEAVKSVVLCLQLQTEAQPKALAGLSLDQLWRHSFTTAKLASRVVLQCINSQRMAADAYTAGLLHNIGQILLANNLPEDYAAVIANARKKKISWADSEMEILGVTHAQVGAYLLGLWGLPVPLLEAVAACQTPAVVGQVEFTLQTVVHVANVLAYDDHGLMAKVPAPKLDAVYLSELELPDKPAAWQKLLSAKPAQPKAQKPAPPPPQKVKTPAVELTQSAKPPRSKMPLVFVVLVAGLIGFGYFNKSGLPGIKGMVANLVKQTTRPGAPAPAETNTPAETADGAAPTNAPAAEEDAVKVQSILYTPSHPMAVINGHTLQVGGRLHGMEVLAITPTNVTLAYDGERKVLTLR